MVQVVGSSIKTLIFDLGNVVLTNDWHYESQEKFDAFSTFFQISADAMEEGWNAAWPDYSIGKTTEDEFWTQFLETAEANEINIAKAKDLYRSYQREMPDMLSLLGQLKDQYTLAVLSNIGREWLDFKRERFGLDTYFSIYVSSGYAGIGKPHARIYELLLQKLKVKPHECLFVDDTQACLDVAEKLGLSTILFSGEIQLEKELFKRGINISV